MKPRSIEALLQEGSSLLGVPLRGDETAMLLHYLGLVQEWNQKINLTSITDAEGIVVRHFLDCLAGSALIARQQRIVDVGTGGGFPGIPLAIALPSASVTLVESTGKKTDFLEIVVAALELQSRVSVIQGRAEELGRDARSRENYDCAVSRAVAPLRVLGEYCLPLVRVGGNFLAYKGPGAFQELEEARTAIETLGGVSREVKSLQLPFDGGNRCLVMIDKVRTCPEKYPRRPGMPKKRPL